MAGPRLRIVARIGLPRSPHGSFVLISLCAHLLFVALLLLVPPLRPEPKFDETYFVQLAPALPGKSSPAPATPPSPKPPPQETPDEGVRIATTEPRRVKPKPDKPKPRPEPEVEQEPVAQEQGPTRSGGFPDTGAEEDGASIAMVGGNDALAWYRASVTSSLYSHWQRPILSGNLTTLEVTVEFEIRRDGTVARLHVTAPSGVPSLDRSALRAVADASPLPPLPAQWRDATLPARFIFQMHPEGF